jgi:ferritin-like metal-binding protein YciE
MKPILRKTSATAKPATSKSGTTSKSTTSAKTTATAKTTGTAAAKNTSSATKTTAAASRGTSDTQTTSAKGLRDLFEVGLKDIYYAEKVLSKSLPKMVKNATSKELVNELNNHLTVTKEQVSRLEQIFKSTGIKAQAVKCDAMDGILKETENLMQNTVKGTVRDAGIISSDQKIDHYEIASYGTLHAYAKTLGEHEAANLLSLTLDEAKRVDAALTRIAMTSINSQAWKADAITTTRRNK